MAELFTDLATSTLSSSLSIGATSLTVQSGDGAKYPNPSGSDFYTLFLFNKSNGNHEFVTCSARSGDVMTIGATTYAYSAGDIVELRVTASFFSSLASFSTTVIQSGENNWDATDTGAADAYAIQLSPTLTAYGSGGLWVSFIPANDCTGGAATLNIDGLGTKSIKDMNNENPKAGMIKAGRPCLMWYYNNTFWLISAAINWADLAYFDIQNTWAKAQKYNANITTGVSGTVAWDVRDQPTRRITISGDITLSNPTNGDDGTSYRLIIQQDVTGGHAITSYGSKFKFPHGIQPSLDGGAGTIDVLYMLYDSVEDVFLCNMGPDYS